MKSRISTKAEFCMKSGSGVSTKKINLHKKVEFSRYHVDFCTTVEGGICTKSNLHQKLKKSESAESAQESGICTRMQNLNK